MRLFGSPPNAVQAFESMSEWPSKQNGDVAWVYVSIHGSSAAEAVTVVVAEEGGRLAIRSIEDWGRP
jgi:hypothetical protein